MDEQRIREIVREEIAAANKQAVLSQPTHAEFIQRLKDSDPTLAERRASKAQP